MISTALLYSIGLHCQPVAEGDSVAIVYTPFQFADGDGIHFYVEQVGSSFRFFDGGETMLHFAGRGVSIANGNDTRFLRTAAKAHGAVFNKDGEIETVAKSAAEGFAAYMQTMHDIVKWEKENENARVDMSLYVEDVVMLLKAANPSAIVKPGGELLGISGHSHKFDAYIDNTPVLAVGVHAASISSALKKLVDCGARKHERLKSLVVLDDRQDPAEAESQARVLAIASDVTMFSDLARNTSMAAH